MIFVEIKDAIHKTVNKIRLASTTARSQSKENSSLSSVLTMNLNEVVFEINTISQIIKREKNTHTAIYIYNHLCVIRVSKTNNCWGIDLLTTHWPTSKLVGGDS